MELRQLRYFVALAEELHFQRAAYRIPLAQSSLSAQIAELEHEIGRSLFVRHAQGCELTDAGTILYHRALALLAAAQDTIDAVAGRSATERPLPVGFFEEGAAELNGPMVAALRRAYPDMRVRHLDQDSWVRLADGTLDVLIGPGTDSFVSHPLFSDGALLAVPVDHALVDADSLEPADAVEHVRDWIEAPAQLYPEFASWVRLDPIRGAPPDRTIGDIPAGILDSLETVARGAALVVTGATDRFYSRPDVRYVRIPDYHAPVCAVHRPHDGRPEIDDIIDITAGVTRDLIDLVPRAVSCAPPLVQRQPGR